MKRILHIVLVLVAAAACKGPRVIPKDTLADIYEEMFLADQLVRERSIPRNQMDTMLVYEAVFEKYGYDTDDYLYSVQYYLKDPERFAKVFEEVAGRLDGELKALDRIIEHDRRVADKLAEKHPQLDSILSPFSEDAVFVGLARVARDSSRYPAWFRLVPVREDSLLVGDDSLSAVRDTLAAVKDSLPDEKPVLERPKEKLKPYSLRERPVRPEPVMEEVAEEEAVAE